MIRMLVSGYNKFKTMTFISALFFSNYLSGAQDWDSIRVELEKEYDISLVHRSKVKDFISRFGIKSHQMDSLNQEILKSDSAALTKALFIIDHYGWPGKDLIGTTANKSIFSIIQHSNIQIMEKYFPQFEKSVIEGQSDKIDYALLKDRILVQNKEKQIYGTQYYYDQKVGKYFFYPIEDRKSANRLRKKVGLGSLFKYSKKYNIEFLDD